MYNDTIKVANKIISSEKLEKIFAKMDEESKVCTQTYDLEIIQNKDIDRHLQRWNLKDYEFKFITYINFYDDTNITIDNYDTFIDIFKKRLKEIKNIEITYSCNYNRVSPEVPTTHIYQYIRMNIHENRISIDLKISEADSIMNNIYNLIKTYIINAPEKYDRIIKKKNLICYKICLAFGFIPSLLLLLASLFVSSIRYLYYETYVLFPILGIFLSFFFGKILMSYKLTNLYKNIDPEVKSRYDFSSNKRIYKYDVDQYINTSEVEIGKNFNNLKDREEIAKLEKICQTLLKYECLLLIFISIIIILFIRKMV